MTFCAYWVTSSLIKFAVKNVEFRRCTKKRFSKVLTNFKFNFFSAFAQNLYERQSCNRRSEPELL